MNAIELIAALKGADEETAMELVERLQCGEIDCSALPTGKDNAVQQAQIWAQEARTQKGIVDEIGKLVGCANDWEMVSAVKAALSANGGEAVGEIVSLDGDNYISTKDDTLRELLPGTKLYTHPAPPSAGVPEGFEFVYIHTLSKEKKTVVVTRDTVAKCMPDYLDDMLDEQICKCQPVGETNVVECGCEDYIEGFELQPLAAPSPDHSGDANKMVEGFIEDQEPLGAEFEAVYEENKGELYEFDDEHIADAGKVVPIGYLTNQAVARLQSDKRLNGEHLYAFKPDDLSKFQAVCLAPTVNESLTIEDFNGMCRIVEAVSQMTDGFAIDQCHMDRAREIVQDATRLRTAGDEGDEIHG